MADGEEDFECWLNGKLRALNTDEGVFGTYIKGILEGEENLDDKTEALEGILSEITEDDIPKHCREILERWQKISCALNSEANSEPKEDVEVKLVRLLESQTLPTVTPKSYTEEERKIREAILAQYSQMSDNEEDEVEKGDGSSGLPSSGTGAVGGGGLGGGSGGLTRNTNAEEVQKAEREKRERAKLESQRKKDKDKEDREKQKQLQQEKKEKRKTQKGERRRM